MIVLSIGKTIGRRWDSNMANTCLMLDSLWDTAMMEASMLYQAPILALRWLKTGTNTYKNTIVNVYMIMVDNIMKQVDMYGVSLSNNEPSLCEAIFSCKATMESIIPRDAKDDSSLSKIFIPSESVRNSLRNKLYGNIGNTDDDAFETFNKFCKLSMGDVTSGALISLAYALLAKIKNLLSSIDKIDNAVDKLIQEYMETCKPYLDFLNTLDKFGECVFATCDYATTKMNYVDDSTSKLHVKKEKDTWVYSSIPWVEEYYQQSDELRFKLVQSQNNLYRWLEANTDVQTQETAKNITVDTGSSTKSYI